MWRGFATLKGSLNIQWPLVFYARYATKAEPPHRRSPLLAQPYSGIALALRLHYSALHMEDQVTFRLPRAVARVLARRARERGVPKSQLVREALETYLAGPVAE